MKNKKIESTTNLVDQDIIGMARVKKEVRIQIFLLEMEKL